MSWPSVLLLWSGWPLVRCIPLGRDILWPSVTLPHLVVRLIFGHMNLLPPPRWGFWSGWTLVRCTTPRQRHLVAKHDTTAPVWQVDLWSEVLPLPMGRDILWPSVILLQVSWPVYSRVSLVPVAMIIPAPWADIEVVAVKKLVLSLFRRLLHTKDHLPGRITI